MDTTIASYEKWLLSDTVPNCIQDNGTMTFQMQFTHTPSPCGIHAKHPQTLKHTNWSRSRAVKPRDLGLFNESSLTLKQDVLPASPSDSEDDDTDIYKAELLAQWGKNTFFLMRELTCWIYVKPSVTSENIRCISLDSRRVRTLGLMRSC